MGKAIEPGCLPSQAWYQGFQDLLSPAWSVHGLSREQCPCEKGRQGVL